MVNFICGGCGASLKKKAVAPHVASCSNSSISCMDCGKVFEKEEYEAHNVCVTEAEKYGPKKKKAEETPVKGKEAGAEGKPKTETPQGNRPYNTFKNVMLNSLHVTDEELLKKIWKLMEENGTKIVKRKNKKRKISTSKDEDGDDDSSATTPKKRGKKAETSVNGNKGESPAKKAKFQKKKKVVK